MERAKNKKRARDPQAKISPPTAPDSSKKGNTNNKKKKKKQQVVQSDAYLDEIASCDGGSKRSGSDHRRPLGVFEFPWQKAEDGIAAYYWDDAIAGGDVFFSSLVDGCSAAIGFPGDRIFQAPAAIALSDEREEGGGGGDGIDCIWSCALNQPLTALGNKPFFT